MGDIYFGEDKYSEVMDYYERALEMYQQMYPEESHVDTGIVLYSLGSVYEERGKCASAIEHYQWAIQICRVTLGEGDDYTQLALRGLAEAKARLAL